MVQKGDIECKRDSINLPMSTLTEVWKHDRTKLEQPKMPLLDSIMEGWKNKDAYAFFCHYLLAVVVGKVKFRKATKNGTRLSSIATCSDEAMALFMLENSWDYWSYIANLGNEKLVDRSVALDVKYTKGHGNMARKYAGITNEGITRYNQLCQWVSHDRKKDKENMEHQEQFDEYYMKK